MVLKQCGENLNKLDITSNTDTKTLTENEKASFGSNVLALLGVFLWKLIVYIVDFIMMLSLIKYDKTYLTFIFIGLSILDLVVGLIRAKITSLTNKNKDINLGNALLDNVRDIEKTTLVKFIMRIVNILYWGYAVYLLYFLNN
jgi:hypothetical protein